MVSTERLEPVAAVRALRADPPGRAGNGRRGKTFGASLEQFEQLLGAARNAPPASAPILLFYALTQAGRAILAAHAPQAWEVHGHGLSVRTERNRIGDTAITPAGDGLFQAVGAATDSGTLAGRTTLAQIWGSIPRLHREAGLGLEAAPIFMVGQEPAGGLRRVIRDEHGTLLREAEPFTARANGYPAIATAELTLNQQGEFVVVALDFPEPAAAEAFDASLWTYLEQFYLRIAPTGDELSGLMTWWALLQALSQLARYEPAGWTAALMPDKSALAVPIEQTLQHAMNLLPLLVLEALVEPAVSADN